METRNSNLEGNAQPETWNSNLEGNALNAQSHARLFDNGKGNPWLQAPVVRSRTYFRQQRKDFEAAGLLSIAEAFRASEPGTAVTDEMKKLNLGFLVPPVPRPVFTKMTETEADRDAALYTDDQFCIFLNNSAPYPECYAESGKYASSGGSLVHMLACPRERIYNAVNLRPTDVELLDYMKTKVLELMSDPEFKEKCLTQLDVKMAAYPALANEYESDKAKFRATGPEQMRFYFHIHPNHSVGHLHMHCLQNNLRTSFIHEHKNAKYDDIVAVLSAPA